MVTVTEWKIVLDRWKKGVRPLKIDDQVYGHQVVKMLEQYDGKQLGMFEDPFEAVTFLIFIALMKEQDKRRWRPAFNP